MPPVSVQIQARQDIFPFPVPNVVQRCSGTASGCSCHRAIPASLIQLSKNLYCVGRCLLVRLQVAVVYLFRFKLLLRILYQIRRCLSNPNCLTGQRSRSDKNLLRPVVKPLILFVGGILVEQRDVLVFDCSGFVNVGDIGPLCQLDSPLNLLVSNSCCSCPTHVCPFQGCFVCFL